LEVGFIARYSGGVLEGTTVVDALVGDAEFFDQEEDFLDIARGGAAEDLVHVCSFVCWFAYLDSGA
jgi:hypothetical protein